MRKSIFLTWFILVVASLVILPPVFSADWLSPLKLSSDFGSAREVDINSDGTKIVYYETYEGEYFSGVGDKEIYFRECKDGRWQSRMRLTQDNIDDYLPSINADGTKIAYYKKEDEDRDIFFTEYRDGTWQPSVNLTDDDYNGSWPWLSDDGTKMTFMDGGDGDQDIFFMEYKDGVWQDPVKLTQNDSNDFFPTMNDDGTKIAYYGNEDEDRDIFFLEYRNGAWQPPVKLTHNDTEDAQPYISSDGTKIVYYWTETFPPMGVGVDNAEIHLLEFKEGVWQTPIPLTKGPSIEYDPSISADGTQVTFVEVDVDGYSHIGVIAYENGAWQLSHRLSSVKLGGTVIFSGGDFRPIINSEGTRIIYYGNATGHYNIYMVSLEESWGTIKGKIEDAASGAGLQDAVVQAYPISYLLSYFIYEFFLSWFQDPTLQAHPISYLATTDSEGNYSLKVKSGWYVVRASKADYTSLDLCLTSVKSGEEITLLPLNLTPEKTSVSGFIQYHYRPLGNAKVVIESGSETELSEEQTTLTNLEGFYEFKSLSSGAYQVSVCKLGYEKSTSEIVYDSKTPLSLDFEMQRVWP